MAIGPIELLLIVWIVTVLAAVWQLCTKLGWSPWLTLLVFIPVVGFVFVIVLAWQALPRAGYSRALVLLMPIPVVGGLFLLWLAFRQWPQPTRVPEQTDSE